MVTIVIVSLLTESELETVEQSIGLKKTMSICKNKKWLVFYIKYKGDCIRLQNFEYSS